MPNKNCFVLTRPDWGDIACKYGHYWYGVIKEDTLALGMEVVDLEKELARKVPLNDAISNSDPFFFSGFGHGNADVYTGQQREVLMETCHGDEILSGRISYLLSCMTARTLGHDIITKGGRTYLGYYPSYTWIVSTQGQDVPGDKYDKAFYDTSNAICMLINRNAYTDFTKQAVMEQVRQWVSWWEQSEDPAASSVIQYLLFDYLSSDDPLRHYGVVSRKEEVESHIPVLQIIRPTDTTCGDPMSLKVMLTCPSGCNLSGQLVKILDDDGIVQGQLELAHFANGVNYSEVVGINAPDEAGRHNWKATYEGDGVHGIQEISWVHLSDVYVDVTIQGTVISEIGTPVEKVPIRLSAFNHTEYTDINGHYSYSGEAVQGESNIRASNHYFYYTQDKRINIVDPGTYVVDFVLALRLSRTLSFNSIPIAVSCLGDRWQEIAPTSEIRLADGFHLFEVPAEIIVGDKSYRFLRWEDGVTNPLRLVFMSATKGILAQYEEVAMETIHEKSSQPWTFIVVGEEHGTITKMVEKFASAVPGETKQVRVGVVCSVSGESCDLTGKMVQVLDHNGELVTEAVLQSWDEVNNCYTTGVVPVTVPSVIGEYTWLGEFLRQ